MNRQKWILAVLVLIFCGVLFWSFRSTPTTRTVGSLTFKPGEQGKKQVPAVSAPSTGSGDDGTVLNVSLLDQKKNDFTGYKRNIFKPIFTVDDTMVLQKRVAASPPKQMVVTKVQPAASVTLPDVSASASPLARFVFLGFLKKGREKTIFLANDNKDILLVKAGNIIADRYQATSITEQSLTLTVVDTGDVIVIPLVENRAMMPGL